MDIEAIANRVAAREIESGNFRPLNPDEESWYKLVMKYVSKLDVEIDVPNGMRGSLDYRKHKLHTSRNGNFTSIVIECEFNQAELRIEYDTKQGEVDVSLDLGLLDGNDDFLDLSGGYESKRTGLPNAKETIKLIAKVFKEAQEEIKDRFDWLSSNPTDEERARAYGVPMRE